MLVERLADSLEQVALRLNDIEKHIGKLTSKVNDISDVINLESGNVVIGGRITNDIDTFKDSLNQSVRMEMEDMTMDIQFKQGIFMGIHPDSQNKIKDLLSEAQVIHVRDMLEDRKRLDLMFDELDRKNEQIGNMANCIEDKAIDSINKVVDLTVDKMDKEIKRIQISEDKRKILIDKAVGNFNKALKDMENCRSELDNKKKLIKPETQPFSVV